MRRVPCVCVQVLRCVELLGGTPSGPDYEAFVAGVIAESNADVALELSDRWVHQGKGGCMRGGGCMSG